MPTTAIPVTHIHARMTRAILFAPLMFVLCFLPLCTALGSSQTLAWSPSESYDKGEDTSLAAHVSGLVLEAHQSQSIGAAGLWYHLGTLNGTTVSWGGSQRLPWSGHWPNVAI